MTARGHAYNLPGIGLLHAGRGDDTLSALIAGPAFADRGRMLPMVLGRGAAGDPVIADLAPMSHLLIAGMAGSDRSMALHAMILSLLYRQTPADCRLILVDPTGLELSAWSGIPHLLAPVLTAPEKAIRALRWSLQEMEQRYRMMASVGVRSLPAFNARVRAAQASGEPLRRRVQTCFDPDPPDSRYEAEELDHDVLPRIVVVVDELADLTIAAGRDVEHLVMRLAQKARAAGIHLILATRRPVDVVTGIIRANLPNRIAFAVASRHESRAILGEQGAERLRGRGAMLYRQSGRGMMRVQAPSVSNGAVRAVADFWRAQGGPDYAAVTADR